MNFTTAKRILNSHISTLEATFDSKNIELIDRCITFIKRTIDKNGIVYTCGNGGSASEADHLSGELIGRFNKNREPIKSLNLATGLGSLTCIGNDFGYEHIFSRPANALLKENDSLVMYSTSGRSINIKNAAMVAINKKATSILITGNNQEDWHNDLELVIRIKSQDTAIIQECSLVITHMICEEIDNDY